MSRVQDQGASDALPLLPGLRLPHRYVARLRQQKQTRNRRIRQKETETEREKRQKKKESKTRGHSFLHSWRPSAVCFFQASPRGPVSNSQFPFPNFIHLHSLAHTILTLPSSFSFPSFLLFFPKASAPCVENKSPMSRTSGRQQHKSKYGYYCGLFFAPTAHSEK